MIYRRIEREGRRLLKGDHEPAAHNTRDLKPKVFISYSRKDSAFVGRLESGLVAAGFSPLIDRTNIEAFEDWWKRIQNLILQSDTIIFVLSPDSVASQICAKEVGFAASLNKRFAPVVCSSVESDTVPDPLRRLNFIFFDVESRFADDMRRLVDALETDLDWVRKHTEFGEAARRWAIAGRPGPRGLLLRSPVLEEAEHWLSSRPNGAPGATADTLLFIRQSRNAALRRRRLTLAGTAAALVLISSAGFFGYRAQKAEASREAARQQAADSNKRSLETASRLAADRALRLNSTGDYTSGAREALRALPKSFTSPDRPVLAAAREALADAATNLSLRPTQFVLSNQPGALVRVRHANKIVGVSVLGQPIRILDTHTSTVETLDLLGNSLFQISSDGHYLASADGSALTVVDRRSKDVKQVSFPGIKDIVFARNSNLIAVLAGDAVHKVSPDGTASSVFQAHGTVDKIAVSPNGGRILLFKLDQPEAALYEADGRLLWRAGAALAAIKAAAFSPDGKLVVIAGKSGALIVDAATGTQLHQIKREFVTDLSFDPEGRYFALMGAARGVVLDRKTYEVVKEFRGYAAAFVGEEIRTAEVVTTYGSGASTITVMAMPLAVAAGAAPEALAVFADPRLTTNIGFSDDGGHLWTMSNNGYVAVSDLRRRPSLALGIEDDVSRLIAWSADGKRLLAVYGKNAPRIWHVGSQTPSYQEIDSADRGSPIAVQDGSRFVARTGRGTLGIWRLADGQNESTLPIRETGAVISLSFSKSGATLLSVGQQTGVRLAFPANGRPDLSFDFAEPTATALDDSGDIAALGFWSGGMALVDTRTGKEVQISGLSTSPVAKLIFADRLNLLVAAISNGSISAINSKTGVQAATASEQPFSATDMTISVNHDLLGTAAGPNAHLWSLPHLEPIPLDATSIGTVKSVSISPDSTLFAACGAKVVVWGIQSRRVISSLAIPCREVSFSPVGHRLAIASDNGTIYAIPILSDQTAIDFLATLDIRPSASR